VPIYKTIEERVELLRRLNAHYSFVFYLESNEYSDAFGKYEWLIFAGNEPGVQQSSSEVSWDVLSNWSETNAGTFRAGFITYEAGSGQIDKDSIGFPAMFFFEPEFIRGKKRNGTYISKGAEPNNLQKEDKSQAPLPDNNMSFDSIGKNAYLDRFEQIRAHLQRGNIYEVNFCQAFEGNRKQLDPFNTWMRLNQLSPAPFSCIVKHGDAWVLGASPERFLCKRQHDIVSQPIKGTTKRTGDPAEDFELGQKLESSEKERRENIMIVDLVRNDLSASLLPGSVHVQELCGVYPFAKVQHLISTICGKLPEGSQGVKTIQKAFPMGSMTGAPKQKAMEIAKEQETFSRGIYSGTIGFFDPDNDFDFSVVIRSIFWNQASGQIRFAAGSAITIGAEPSAEYDECMLKAESIIECLQDV